ncbi:MAG: hypothetical protein ABR520_11910 [Mycobacteriales bacterium]
MSSRSRWVILALVLLMVLPIGDRRTIALAILLLLLIAVVVFVLDDVRRYADLPYWVAALCILACVLLSPIGGFVVWLLVRRKWTRTPRGSAPAASVDPPRDGSVS